MRGPIFEPAPTEGFDAGAWIVAPRFVVNGEVKMWGVWSAPDVLVCSVRLPEHARLICAAPRLLAAAKALLDASPWAPNEIEREWEELGDAVSVATKTPPRDEDEA